MGCVSTENRGETPANTWWVSTLNIPKQHLLCDYTAEDPSQKERNKNTVDKDVNVTPRPKPSSRKLHLKTTRALKTAMCGVNSIGSHDYLTAQMLHRFITQLGKLYRWHHCLSISRRWFNNKAIFIAQFPWKKCLLEGNKSFGTRFRVLLNVCWQIKINSDWRNTEKGSVDKERGHWAVGKM